MKKNPIIFIAMLVALAFTSCQMNTDDTGVNPVVPPAPTYTITVNAINGTASYPKTAKAGEKVTITATADSGYVFDSASSALSIPDCKVSDDKKSITWNLTMPEKDVTINVTFKAATPAPTYKITVTATNGTVTLSKTEAKVGETITVTEINPESDYEFDLGKVTIKDANGNTLSVDATTKSFVMPASNVTITVEFVKITDGGNPTTPTTDDGEDNNGGEPPVTNEYTVSVASGIKGGHIEVSLDNATWTTLSTSTKYAKNTKLYVRAVADKHYEYKDGLRTDGLEGQLNYIMLNSNAELNANFVIKNESLTPGSLTFNGKKANLSNYRRLVMIDIKESDFSESYKNARLAFGFSDGFYSINKRIGSTSTDKYFYVYDTEINTFENVNNLKRIFVAINLDNSYELPDGKIYVLFPNLKNSDGKSVMYVAEESTSGTFVVNVDGANTNYSASEKYYFDASQL